MNPSESHSDEAHYTSRSRLLGRALYSKKSRSAVPDAAVPVAVPVSDASYSTSDSDDEAAPFPLPASQIQDYPTEQRQQQDKWSKTFNFFERYVCVVSETGLQCGGPDDVWEQDDNDNINQDNVVTVVRNNDESSVTETPPALDQQHKKKKTVRWNLESLACHSTTVDDFYDRYMLVVSEVGLQCHPHAHDAGETKQADDDNNGTVPAATRNQRRSKTSGAAGSAGGTNQEPDTWDLQNNPCVQYTQGFSLSKLWNSLVSDTNSNTDDADTATRDLTDEITISTKSMGGETYETDVIDSILANEFKTMAQDFVQQASTQLQTLAHEAEGCIGAAADNDNSSNSNSNNNQSKPQEKRRP